MVATRDPHDEARRRDLLAILERLHRHKDAAYGDAWRKRGEVIAIFANMARKYDRLLVAFAEGRPATTEPLADTVADLCVYAGKYLTWLAETQPDAYNAADLPVAVDWAAADRGPDALAAVFAALGAAHSVSAVPETVADEWDAVQHVFERLERGLMAQATPDARAEELLSWPVKVSLAWDLADHAAWLLVRLDQDQPELLAGLRAEVDRMDQGIST